MQALTLLFYLAGALLLTAGPWCPQPVPSGSHGVTLSIQKQPPLPFDLTIWTPPRKEFQLEDSRPDRLQSALARRDDDACIRPAWGMFVGVVVLFLYLMGASHEVIWRLY
jgi:hypothetical protein